MKILGRIALGLLLALGAGDAFAAADTCTITADGTWSATGTHPTATCTGGDNNSTIDSGDRVTWGNGVDVTTPAGSTIGVTEVQTTGTGTWSIASSASTTATTITLSACNNGASSSVSTVDCGALGSSSWTAQGVVLLDSLALNASTPVTSLTTDGNTIRIHPAAAPSPAPAAGDWIKVTSGPGKHAWYRISSVSFGGCPTAGATCAINFDLYEHTATTDEMAYASTLTGWGVGATAGATSVGRRLDAVYATGSTSVALPLAEQAYFGNPTNTLFNSLAVSGVATPMDRCIELCSWENASTPAYNCNNATVIGADGDYQGWTAHLQATGASGVSSVDVLATVTRSYNNITCSGVFSTSGTTQASDCIANEGAVVDRLCFSQPIPQIANGSGNARSQRSVILYPPFNPVTDSFSIHRMVNFVASNAERDNSLGFHVGTTIDFDNVYLRNFAPIWVDGTASTNQSPMNNTVIRTACVGSGAGTATQNNCTNPHGPTLINFSAPTVTNLAVIDAAVPVDVGPSGSNSYCPDVDANGTCDGGGTTVDGARDDGLHGLDLTAAGAATVTGYYARHLGDDAYSSDTNSTDGTIRFDEPFAWYTDLGTSTECWEPGWSSLHVGFFTVRNARAIRCAQLSGLAGVGVVVATGLDSGSGGGSNGLDVDGLFSIQRGNQHAAIVTATTKLPSRARNMITFNQDVANDGYLCNAISECRNSYGWNIGGIFTGVSGEDSVVSGIFARLGTDTGTAPLAVMGDASVTDNVFVNRPNVVWMNEATPDTGEFSYNTLEAAATGTNGVFGSITDGEVDFFGLGFTGNLVIRSPLFTCGDATWGARNQSLIGENAVLDMGQSRAITNVGTNCTPAAQPTILSTDTWSMARIGIPSIGAFGPRKRVGVPPSADIYDLILPRSIFYEGAWTGGGGTRPCATRPGGC